MTIPAHAKNYWDMFRRLLKKISNLKKEIPNIYYREPKNLRPLKDDVGWYSNKFIAHALGNANGIAYSNSREALKSSLAKGFKVLETDINFTADNFPVLSHSDVSKLSLNDFKSLTAEYTTMSLLDIIEEMQNHNFYLLLDFKDSSYAGMTAQFIKEKANERIFDNFIFQINSAKQFCDIKKVDNFRNFHYNFGLDRNPNTAIPFLLEKGIHTVSVAQRWAKKKNKLRYLNKYNIKCYAFTINDTETAKSLLQENIWGIFTDSISPDFLDAKETTPT